MPDYTTQLKDNGITANSDGLLKDFIARGLYTASMDAIAASIARRETEIKYLKQLAWEICHNEIHTEQVPMGETSK